MKYLSWRGGWPAFLGLLLLSLMFRMPKGGGVAPAQGDVPAYLAAAYHLRTDHVYTMSRDRAPARPALGREPAYPVFLAGLMEIDPGFGQFTLACLTANDACPGRIYRGPSLANLLLIVATGAAMFVLGRLVCGTPPGGLVAAGYLLANTHANKGWADLMSDRLAVLFLALGMLALAQGWSGRWRGRRAIYFALAGAAFGALTLTKAIFLPFCLAAWACAALHAVRCRPAQGRPFLALFAAAAFFILLVGGWGFRNWTVSGMARLTDQRSGIALSTRAVFDDMSARDYAAALVYWTDSIGPRLARRWFGKETADRFDFDHPGGYYDVGQNGYGRRVADTMARDHLDYWQATAAVDRRIIAGIKGNIPGYLATMPPLIYRGLWLDEFLLLGIPCLIWAGWQALRRRDRLHLLLLSTGAFNMLAYAALSLNIQRYQMTSMPAIALAAAMVLTGRRYWVRRPYDTA